MASPAWLWSSEFGAVRFAVELGLSGGDEAGGLWDVDEWDTGVWGGDSIIGITWYDVTPRALTAQAGRGREIFFRRMRTGTSRIVLDNADGIWNPIAGPLPEAGLRLRPGRAARISGYVDPDAVGPAPLPPAAVVGDWVPLSVTYVDTLSEQYAPGGYGSTMRLDGLDGMSLLSRDDPPALETPRPGELSSDRVIFLLDEFGWPGTGPAGTGRDIASGTFQLQSSVLARSRLEEIQLTADAEAGAFWCDGRGWAIWRPFGWLTDDTFPRSTAVQAQIGGSLVADALPIGRVRSSWTAQKIYNDIQLSRRGGEIQRITDTVSWGLYRIRTYRRLDYENASDADLLTVGNDILAATAYDRLRLEGVTVVPRTPRQFATALGLRIGDLVSVTVEAGTGSVSWSYTIEAHVSGLEWRVSADDATLDLTLDDSFRGGPDDSFRAFNPDAFDEGFR